MPNKLARRAESLSGNALDKLQESIDIQATLETQLLERIGSGESSHAWTKLAMAVAEYIAADEKDNYLETEIARANAFDKIAFCVQKGLDAAHLRRDIQSIHESQRKLTETLTKCRKEVQETYTREMWNEMLSILGRAIVNEFEDIHIRTRFENAILLVERTMGHQPGERQPEATA